MTRKLLIPVAALALCVCAAVPAAQADGLPVLGIDVGAQGVESVSAPVRYVTVPAAGRTIVARTATHGGRVFRHLLIAGNFTIPAVAYDGSASGLSADGSRLVLIQPRRAFPRARTTFAVLDAHRLKLQRVISLRGDFSFDAISARGRTMFLIHYTSAADPTKYEVRAFDLRRGRLVAKPIVDPHEAGEAMRGSPISRATSGDGRWAYTLYDGAGATPFVHALDTKRRGARCIDLDLLAGRQNLWGFRLHVTAGKLTIGLPGQPTAAAVDTATFRVSEAD
jgi:hypothetical protein